jgi:3-isopropylmalate/(R)-2-methylmalate dehydratase small subunit
VYGDHVDTDAIIPARYLMTSEPAELAAHCMEDIDERFAGAVAPGDVLVAGENFGCGSSREHAPIAIQASGVGCVIAKSFARIFFRNALNIGLPVLICPSAAAAAEPGQRIEVDLARGTIVNRTLGASYDAEPYPAFMLELIRAGGLVPYTRERLLAGGGRRPAPGDSA